MDLNLGGIVRQTTAPVLDALSVARTGTVDQIASFLGDNPGQRGAIETALAASGRTGDLSAIVERAGTAVGTVTDGVRTTVDTVVDGTRPVVDTVGTTVTSVVRSVETTTAGLASRIDTSALAEPARTIANGVASAGDIASRIVSPATALLARASGDIANGPLADVRPGALETRVADALAPNGAPPAAPRAGDVIGTGLRDGRLGDAIVAATREGRLGELVTSAAREGRLSELITAAAKEGRLGELIAAATKEGRLAELIADARTLGRLPELIAATKTLDGVLAAFAGKGGLSATELALFARAGLLSEADVRALRAAGVPIDVEEPAPVLPPRDGPAEERLDRDPALADGVAVAGLTDPALSRFDAGAIRFASRAAFETYGVLGPPGGTIIAADAFEGMVRAAEGDLAAVERRLGLDPGILRDADTLIAYIDRQDLAALRLPGDRQNRSDAWLPGADVPTGLADLARAVPFREVALAD